MKLLLTGAYNYTKSQLDKLIDMGHEIKFFKDEREEINFDVSEIEGIVCNGLFLYNDIKKFKKLKYVQLTSSGVDRVPLDYIRENNIQLFTAKGVYSAPMAEWVILKILEIYKYSHDFRNKQNNKIWEKRRDLLELTDKVVTIVGCGNVGLEVAKRIKAFGSIVYGVGRRKIESTYIDKYFDIDNIDEAISKSDIVVISIALAENTKYLFDKENLDKMKNDSVLINVSRGLLIKECDLCNFLDKGKFLGVALDVMEIEPLPQNSKLWEYNNVIITPHNSFVSDMCNKRLFDVIYENLNRQKDGDL